MNPRRRAVLVLGMHRSGTSALTRVINLMGAGISHALIGPTPNNNAKGFWESKIFASIHSQILDDLSSAWDSTNLIGLSAGSAPNYSEYANALLNALKDDFDKSSLFVVKDPRLCRLLPLWIDVLRQFDAEPQAVHIIRNPLEVARSLNARDGFSETKSMILWLQHVLMAERDSRTMRRTFLTYNDLLADWRSVVTKIAQDLNIIWPKNTAVVGARVEEFLSIGERHHHESDWNIDTQVAAIARHAYDALTTLSKNTDDEQALKLLDELVDTARSEIFEPSWANIHTEAGEESPTDADFRNLKFQFNMKQLYLSLLRQNVAKHRQSMDVKSDLLEEDKRRLLAINEALLEENKSRLGQIDTLASSAADQECRLAALEAELEKHQQLSSEQAVSLQEKVQLLIQTKETLRKARRKHRREKQAAKDKVDLLATQSASLQRLVEQLTKEVSRGTKALRRLSLEKKGLDDKLEHVEALLDNERKNLAVVRSSFTWRLTLPLRLIAQRFLRLLNQLFLFRRKMVLVKKSGLFDVDWYLVAYPDVAVEGINPIEHYLRFGLDEGRSPSPRFDGPKYLHANPDVYALGVNPLLHYIQYGKSENRRTFDVDGASTMQWAKLPELAKCDHDEILRVRQAFDASYYLRSNPDVSGNNEDPFAHYITFGWKEGRDPTPYFCTNYYLEAAPDIVKAGINPFVHYVLHGIGEKRPALPFKRRLERTTYEPLVTVIIPNFNHAKYLDQRITSIIDQTYDNIEILILDDCSTDESAAVIRRYVKRYPNKISCIFNDKNSGNVFRQWRKGINKAHGELIWVCESDDFCEPTFLQALVVHFKDRSVNIAFGRIQFSDSEGNFQPGLDQYRNNAEDGIWGSVIVRPAKAWFSNGFGVNNLIANVGGCIWRSQDLPVTIWSEAETYSVLGDWFLYCNLASGGQIVYDPSAIAYFRQHGENTSVTAFTTPGYYREHEQFMRYLTSRWQISGPTIERFIASIDRQYQHFKLVKKFGALDQYISKKRLLESPAPAPHVLIAFLGFHYGGGELFPINLANALQNLGLTISMLAFDMNESNSEVLRLLNHGIAVYDASWVQEIGVDKFISEAGVSLIHSHMIALESLFFERLQLQSNLPYVVTLHGSYEGSSISPKRLELFVDRVSHWVYTADKNLNPFRAIRLPQDRISKIGNAMPIDPRPYPKSREELNIGADTIVFTLVARGIKGKGWSTCIAAFKKMQQKFPRRSLHLLLCGDGPESQQLLPPNEGHPSITFLGYQSCIHGLYRISDCALVPTRFSGESFPLCIIQAMQVGVPIIATDVGEIAAMLGKGDERAGLLIEPEPDARTFIEKLTAAMTTMLEDELRTKLSKVALKKGMQYRITDVALQYKDLYMRTLTAAKTCDDAVAENGG